MEINGITYKKREQKSKTKEDILIEYLASLNKKPVKPLPPGIDIVEEFKLIQEKKSEYSKAIRDRIIEIFNNTYEKDIV